MRKRLGLVIAVLAGLAWSGVASAVEDYPARPITMIVPFAAGGAGARSSFSRGRAMVSSQPEADTVNTLPMNSGLLYMGPTAL